MLFAAGLVLLALGVFSGVFLVLVPLGLLTGTAGPTLWVLFPTFTVVGYLMAAAPSENRSLPALSRVTGVLLLALALVAAVALVLEGGSIVEARGDTFSLWYVLGIGLVLGAAGLSSHRRTGEDKPAA